MITLSESAVKKVQEYFHADPESKGKHLRVAVVPGGCSGFEYAFSFDEKKTGDAEISFDGFTLVVDPNSAGFLKNSKIDYYENPTAQGFKIDNPNVKSSCGCGKSNSF